MADTDADGKMNIEEFSIACKLINLKLRGYDVPKGLPPSLLASLKVHTPPAIPPLPNAALINPPSRPEPPKVAPMMAPQGFMVPGQPPLVPGLGGQVPVGIPASAGPMGGIQTGIVPPTVTHMRNIGGVSDIPTGKSFFSYISK